MQRRHQRDDRLAEDDVCERLHPQGWHLRPRSLSLEREVAMQIFFPVRLDRNVFPAGGAGQPVGTVAATDDFDFVDQEGLPISVSGWDSSPNNAGTGTRLTNLAGIHNGELTKTCPNCDQTLPHSAYGDVGRTTRNYRDQSNCTDCRGRYAS